MSRLGETKVGRRGWLDRIRCALRGDAGMSTAEYAMGTVAAVAFAAVLYTVVTGDAAEAGLTALIERGLRGGEP
ncbi:DUF4244 domain-containing protein [Saccharopolyspora sp. HNM0983]|uniref:DUF4244 domain-containing protein n=1 Tax=Saccharopolyspora montiporae TaxID=2781240 RepID=A0A929FZ99_9PSEU|nr:DUF4244 domain-containing protein [Saccharopolyspora sp. HNM0983]MBE9374169.1 DUF4244 domain-containing protein [Saccharopolyspora sp. HNM0983]